MRARPIPFQPEKGLFLSCSPHFPTATNSTMSREWNIPASTIAKNTVNRIRSVIDGTKMEPNPAKAQISLSIGKLCEAEPTLSRCYLVSAWADNQAIRLGTALSTVPLRFLALWLSN